jgi:hypothetical protein
MLYMCHNRRLGLLAAPALVGNMGLGDRGVFCPGVDLHSGQRDMPGPLCNGRFMVCEGHWF